MSIFRKCKPAESKWHNKPCVYDGIKFASHKERDRYIFLKEKERDGEISNLQCQTKIELVPAVKKAVEEQLKTKVRIKEITVQKAIYYVADFTYERNGETVYEDVKGSPKSKTKVYALKKKMMLAIKQLEVKEIYSPTEWIQSKPQR